jgi:hypothetical protein
VDFHARRSARRSVSDDQRALAGNNLASRGQCDELAAKNVADAHAKTVDILVPSMNPLESP